MLTRLIEVDHFTLYTNIKFNKFGREVQKEAGQKLTVLPREHTGYSKHLLPTTQEKTLRMDITRWPRQKSD